MFVGVFFSIIPVSISWRINWRGQGERQIKKQGNLIFRSDAWCVRNSLYTNAELKIEECICTTGTCGCEWRFAFVDVGWLERCGEIHMCLSLWDLCLFSPLEFSGELASSCVATFVLDCTRVVWVVRVECKTALLKHWFDAFRFLKKRFLPLKEAQMKWVLKQIYTSHWPHSFRLILTLGKFSPVTSTYHLKRQVTSNENYSTCPQRELPHIYSLQPLF